MSEITKITEENTPETPAHSGKSRTLRLAVMAMMVAVICISAYISIPLPNGTHITLLNFVVTLVALSFPLPESIGIIGVWFLMGLAGLPVYIAGNSGIGYITGALGGFTISFLLVAVLIPLTRGKKYNRVRYTLSAVIFSALLVDVCGTLWLTVIAKMSLKEAFLAGFAPFIILDTIKVIIAAQIVPAIRKLINAAL